MNNSTQTNIDLAREICERIISSAKEVALECGLEVNSARDTEDLMRLVSNHATEVRRQSDLFDSIRRGDTEC